MKRKSFKIESPAKINIGLYVLNKRSDGYHNIETIFYPIKLHDKLKLSIQKIDSPENEIKVISNPVIEIEEKDNICYKAVKLFFKEFKTASQYKVEIDIKKKIPIGAGLGGGSSNAASVLKILAKYFRKEKNTSRLKNIALKLGSDVPFFLYGKPAYAVSRGEKLTLLPKFKINYNLLIVNPNIQISTKRVYEELNVKRQKTKGKNRITQSLNKTQKFNLKDKEKYQNDFEAVVFKKYPAIGKIKERMYKEEAAFSLMSGSGSTVFGFFEKNITGVSKYFKNKGYKVFTLKCK